MQRVRLASQRQTLALLFFLLVLYEANWRHAAWAAPQNPFDSIGLGAMSVIGSARDIIESGGAVRKEHGIDTPLFSVHSKAEAGIGNAMRPRADDSDERRRRRRRGISDLARNKQASCKGGGGSGGAGGGAGTPTTPMEMAEEVRRRMSGRRNKRTTQTRRSGAGGKKTKSTGRSSKTKYSRRGRHRRHAEPQDDGGSGSGSGDAAQRFADTVRNALDTFATSVKEVLQRVQQAFNAEGSS